MSGIPLGPFGVTLLATAVALLVMMAVTFVVALKVGRHSVVDSAWGIGIALSAVVSLLASAGHGQPVRRYLLLAAAVIWGLRLSGYVTWRNHGKGEDPRYRDLLNKAKGNKNLYALRSVYLLQALILWLACLPIQAGMLERAPAGAVTVVGGVLWLGGFIFESVGDWQLARFKADPANQGQIMNRGLWQYTRHPNYFGDFCMWWGLFLIALGSWAELPTAIGPLLMSVTLIRGTGGRLTDRRMASSKPQYADYAARTSGFFPLPPRKSRLCQASTLSCSRHRMARRWIGGRPPPRRFPSYPPVAAAVVGPARSSTRPGPGAPSGHERCGTAFRSRSAAGNGFRYVCPASQGSSPLLA